jgi:hypothetical protein
MTQHEWNYTAKQFAQEMLRYRPFVERGAVPIRCGAENPILEEGSLVVGVFGNERDDGGRPAQGEVDKVRNRFKDAGMQELGFGLSEDGFTWALLFEAEKDHYQTVAGRELQKELLAILLQDVILEARRS